jgi:mannosyltransferase OCH1-like enzyme
MDSIPEVLHLTSNRVPLTGAQGRLAAHNADVLTGWRLRVWSDADNDALVAAHYPQYLATFRAMPFGVMRADAARLMYLATFGGWYSDTDYEWLRIPDVPGRAVLPMSRPELLGNAVMGSVPGHPLWSLILESLFTQDGLLEADRGEIEELTGPGLITRHWEAARAFGDVALPERRLFHSMVHQPAADSIGLHHTKGTWRDEPIRQRLAATKRRVRRALGP